MVETSRANIFPNPQKFIGRCICTFNTALDGPKINQSNCDILSKFTTKWRMVHNGRIL